MKVKHTRAEGVADFDDLLDICFLTSGGAVFGTTVTDTIAEIHACAETLDIVGFAAEFSGFIEHILDACFLRPHVSEKLLAQCVEQGDVHHSLAEQRWH